MRIERIDTMNGVILIEIGRIIVNIAIKNGYPGLFRIFLFISLNASMLAVFGCLIALIIV